MGALYSLEHSGMKWAMRRFCSRSVKQSFANPHGAVRSMTRTQLAKGNVRWQGDVPTLTAGRASSSGFCVKKPSVSPMLCVAKEETPNMLFTVEAVKPELQIAEELQPELELVFDATITEGSDNETSRKGADGSGAHKFGEHVQGSVSEDDFMLKPMCGIDLDQTDLKAARANARNVNLSKKRALHSLERSGTKGEHWATRRFCSRSMKQGFANPHGAVRSMTRTRLSKGMVRSQGDVPTLSAGRAAKNGFCVKKPAVSPMLCVPK